MDLKGHSRFPFLFPVISETQFTHFCCCQMLNPCSCIAVPVFLSCRTAALPTPIILHVKLGFFAPTVFLHTHCQNLLIDFLSCMLFLLGFQITHERAEWRKERFCQACSVDVFSVDTCCLLLLSVIFWSFLSCPGAAFFHLCCSVEGSGRQRKPDQPCSLSQQLIYLTPDLCDFLL